MATVFTLEHEGSLIRYELEAEDPAMPSRKLLFSAACFDWYDETLPYLPAEKGKALTPLAPRNGGVHITMTPS